MCCEGTELSDLLASKIDRAQASRTLCLVYKQQTRRGLSTSLLPSVPQQTVLSFFNERVQNIKGKTSRMWLFFTDYPGKSHET